jgi:TolB protein
MKAPSGQYFFVSYSRADTVQQQKIVAELRGRGVNVWVDTENLVPGSPAWEREIERSIRGAIGIIVLLSPDSSDSQWVRREISFTEEHDKPIFPVHIRGDENESIPLRLSSHQRVDLRRNFSKGLDQLADALKDYLGATLVNKKLKAKSPTQKSFILPSAIELKKYALPAALIMIGVLCISGVAFAGRLIANAEIPTKSTSTPSTVEVTSLPTETEPVINYPDPTGKIVYTCQIKGDEICIVDPDGSNWQQLTDSPLASFNASLSPDGKKVVYITSDGKNSEIYELEIASQEITQLTELKKNLGSPEISPDDQHIIFHYRSGNNNVAIWIMDRDGSNPHEFYSSPGKDVHDATWAPDGAQILFALGKGENNQFYIMDADSGNPQLVNDTIDSRGRSDWSKDLISLDQGDPYLHEVFVMNVNGSNLRQITQGNNSQGASLSPDGMWIAFTAYTFDSKQNPASCEIFIMRVDGSEVSQLTDNNYCDFQPRWGN